MSKKRNIVEQVKAIPTINEPIMQTPTDEDFELVLAWLNGDVRGVQITKYKQFNSSAKHYRYVARVLRCGIEAKRIKMVLI